MFPKGFEWIIILVVALLLFGPKNLPKLGQALGKTVKNLREGMSGEGDEPTGEAEVVEEEEDDEVAQLEAQLAEARAKKKAAAKDDE